MELLAAGLTESVHTALKICTHRG